MMGQFLLGLFAGVVVGLVMEWVIDWTGLLPKRTTSQRTIQTRMQAPAPDPGIKSANEPVIPTVAASPSTNPDIIEE
ncbi:MAG: hypothetical protein IT328_16060 [Caldilineaceae bacterium]|nr:hypothetical protein [Caldilineaceae bacterium]